MDGAGGMTWQGRLFSGRAMQYDLQNTREAECLLLDEGHAHNDDMHVQVRGGVTRPEGIVLGITRTTRIALPLRS